MCLVSRDKFILIFCLGEKILDGWITHIFHIVSRHYQSIPLVIGGLHLSPPLNFFSFLLFFCTFIFSAWLLLLSLYSASACSFCSIACTIISQGTVHPPLGLGRDRIKGSKPVPFGGFVNHKFSRKAAHKNYFSRFSCIIAREAGSVFPWLKACVQETQHPILFLILLILTLPPTVKWLKDDVRQ